MDTTPLKMGRPHFIRAAVAGALALAGMVAARFGDLCAGRRQAAGCSADLLGDRGLAIAGAGLLLVAGIAAIRATAHGIRSATEYRLGTARGASLSFLMSTIGYVVLVLATLSALDVDLGALLLGGAITGVIVGIAAQQTLGNFFAGIVLMLARPFAVGETIVLKSGALGGEYEGVVTDMGIFYVSLATERGKVDLPNAGVLAAAIGPGARSEKKDEVDDAGDEA